MTEEQNKFIPPVTPTMYKAVSEYRRAELEGEVNRGLFRDGSTRTKESNLSPASYAVPGAVKYAQSYEASAANSFKGGVGNTTQQIPEVYSPLWLTSNLNLPRDRATMNAWCRSFYALNPIVQNAINLHSTYPISKLNIKCPNKKVENLFNEQIEELGLMNICSQAAQEYWLLGEAVVYGELDERNAKWSRLLIQNPDYIVIKRSVIANEPIIMLRPDENLRRICMSNLPSDIEQRKQLNETIIEYVRRGQNIPLDNLYVSHLARKISPYEVRGTGLPVSVFRSLMLFDLIKECKFAQAQDMINPMRIIKIGGGTADYRANPVDLDAWREVWACHDEDTEVLTNNGFKKITEITSFEEDNNLISNIKCNDNIKIACFNPNNERLEYYKPLETHIYNYSGEMYHFHNKKVDVKVTPNHDMWVSTKEVYYHGSSESREEKWSEWRKVKAEDIKLSYGNKFRSTVNWVGEEPSEVDIIGNKVPIELYLKYLGYLISEGSLVKYGKYKFTTQYCQTHSKYYEEMRDTANEMALFLNKYCYEYKDYRSTYTNNCKDISSFIFNGKDIFDHFKSEISTDGNSTSLFKKLPKWVLTLSPRLLKILLNAACQGDGSFKLNKNNTVGYEYYTTSKELSDNIYEIAFKAGYAPVLSTSQDKRDNRNLIYRIRWSENISGKYPYIYKYSTNSNTKEKKDTFNKEIYNGKVWCFTVPTGLFITRRNGKITIQGNSATADKNFKIFTHDAVNVETVGAGQGIYDTSNDFTQLLKEMYAGLMVPQIIIEGGGDITYANAGVSLDVLRQRYMQFRNMMAAWLRKKIFQPIAKLNEFYDYVDGEKVLIIPEVDWNHMSLFDLESYVQTLRDLTTGEQGGKRVSVHTLYRSLGLEWEEERRKIRKEDIAEAIRKKEQASLDKMTLNELRTLNEEDEIPEILETPLPGESPYDTGSSGAEGGPGGPGGLPGLEPGAAPPEMPAPPIPPPTP